MICDVCGRDNPERLTFCQECGKRLRVATGGGASPTPPQGFPAQPVPAAPAPPPASPGTVATSGPPDAVATQTPPPNDAAVEPARPITGTSQPEDARLRFDEPILAGVATRSDAPPASLSRRASRPEAPVLAFGFDEARPDPTPPPQPAQNVASQGAICIHCNATNPRTHRFCTTCGGTLGGSTTSQAVGSMPLASGEAHRAAAAGDAHPEGALAPVAPLPAQPTTPHMAPRSGPVPSPSTPAPVGPVYAGAAWTPPATVDPPTDPEPAPVVAAPVVSIASQQPQVAATIVCARCQGQCSAAARYCKYCGSLLEPRGASEAQAATPNPSQPPGAGGSAPPQGWTAAQPPATPYAGSTASAPHVAPAALALVPPTAAPIVGWAPSAPPVAQPGSGLGHAPTLPQPPQLGVQVAPRAVSPATPSSAIASLAAQAAPAAYPAQAHAPQQGFGGTQAIAGSAALPTSSLQAPAPSPQASSPQHAPSPSPSPGVQASQAGPTASRASAGAPRLVVLRDDGSEGTAFPLGADIVDLGRREGDILLHDDLYVSPRHARFRREGDRVRVIDLASTNGIYLRLRGQHRLASGNLILLGLEVLQFQLVKDAAPPASPHAPSAAGPRGRGAGAPAAGGPALAVPVQPFGSDFDAIEATWAGRGNPWSQGAKTPAAVAPASVPVQGFGQASQHGTLVFGSPATSRRASLHQRTIEGIVRDVYHLVRDEVVLGREGADIVFSADPFMSRRHAVIRRDPATDVYTLVDLESSNGTFVRIENDAFLKHGDEIRVGRHLFRFDREARVDRDGAIADHAVSDQASHV